MRLEEVKQLKIAARSELQSESFEHQMMDGAGGGADTAVDVQRVTLGVGWKPGKETGDDAYWLTARIRTPVRQPLAEEKIRTALRKVAGDDFELRYTGPVYALRPFGFGARAASAKLTIGSSVSHVNTLGGTLGFFARSRGDGARGFVSANHVIANLDRARPGDSVVSPSESQRGVGELVRFVNLGGGGEKRIDAAFAKLNGVEADRSSLPNGGTLSATAALPEESRRVMKFGARTQFTVGKVLSFNHDTFSTTAYHGLGRVDFDDQIEIESASRRRMFATDGDSGALAYNEHDRAVGLVFAATLGNGRFGNGLTYVNPIQFVLDDLEVDLDVT